LSVIGTDVCTGDLRECATRIAREAVKRMNIDGVEHVVISSMTLPDDIVMNGGLYPADEIEKSYESLERTLAPVEHPTDTAGNFISATDPSAIHNFYAGAYNENVRRENGRVAVGKVINVAEAMKTDRGKRLLDRVAEIENNPDARPIHTSVGVFVEVETLPAPQANAAGQQFSWIARNMQFDHDAILLDSVGAAQPHQGVGMAVNSNGEEIEVQTHLVTSYSHTPQPNEMSVDNLRDALLDALKRDPTAGMAEWVYIDDIFPDRVIYSAEGDNLFEASYVLDENGRATIVSLPLPVKREVTYQPRNNNQPQGDAMKELMLKALADAGVTVNADIDDAALMAKYNEHLAKQNTDDEPGPAAQPPAGGDAVAEAVANALAPLTEKLDGVVLQLNERNTEELDKLADLVGNSDKFPGIDVEAAKAIPLDTLKTMAANCQSSHGLPLNVNQGPASAAQKHDYGMPGSAPAVN